MSFRGQYQQSLDEFAGPRSQHPKRETEMLRRDEDIVGDAA
jgi:hypothetical protein